MIEVPAHITPASHRANSGEASAALASAIGLTYMCGWVAGGGGAGVKVGEALGTTFSAPPPPSPETPRLNTPLLLLLLLLLVLL
jgi:hypothetical protein